MRIVNTSDGPFEFSFDSVVYGPYQPGTIIDLPYEVANHGIKRSQVLDEMGNITGYRVQSIEEAKSDPEKFKNLLVYNCPFGASDQCTAKPFKSVDELKKHMETHWVSEPTDDLFGAPAKPVVKK